MQDLLVVFVYKVLIICGEIWQTNDGYFDWSHKFTFCSSF